MFNSTCMYTSVFSLQLCVYKKPHWLIMTYQISQQIYDHNEDSYYLKKTAAEVMKLPASRGMVSDEFVSNEY